jgi:hypothetical protein
MVRDSVVGITTRYELDGPGIEFWWELDLSQPFILAEEPIQPPLQWVLDNCPGGRRVLSVQCVVLTTYPPSNAEVKERVELYL